MGFSESENFTKRFVSKSADNLSWFEKKLKEYASAKVDFSLGKQNHFLQSSSPVQSSMRLDPYVAYLHLPTHKSVLLLYVHAPHNAFCFVP